MTVSRMRGHRTTACVALLCAAHFLFYAPVWFGGFYFRTGHIDFQSEVALRTADAEAIRSGTFSFWDPHPGFGYSVGASSRAPYYPMNLFLALHGPPYESGISRWMAFHHLIASVGFLGFLSALGLRPAAVVLGALAFAATPRFFVNWHRGIPAFTFILTYFPWIALGIVHASRVHFRRGTALSGVAIGMCVLASVPSLMHLVVWCAVLVAAAEALDRRSFRPLAAVPPAGAIGAAVGAMQLLPQLTAVLASERIGMDRATALSGSFDPREIYLFLAADRWLPSERVEAWGYVGLFLLIPLAAALFTKRGRIWALLPLAALLFAFGRYTPVYEWVVYPIFPMVRYPLRFTLLFVFGAHLLASFGLDFLVRRLEGPPTRAPRKRAVWTMLGASAVWGAVFVALYFAREPLRAFYVERLGAGGGEHGMRTWSYALAWWTRLGLAAGAFLAYHRARALPRGARWGLAALAVGIFVDAAAARGFLFRGPSVPALPDAARPIVARFAQREVEWRYLPITDHPAVPRPWHAVDLDLPCFLPHDALFTPEHVRALTLATRSPRSVGGVYLFGRMRFPDADADLLGAWSVRYVLTDTPFAPPWRAVERISGVVVNEAPRVLPRLYPATRWREAPPEAFTAEAARDLLAEGVVVVHDPPPPPPGGAARILARRLAPERIEAVVESDSGALLVVNDAYGAGWSAEVEGRPAPILRANLAVRAVPLPPGRVRVVLRYAPWEILVGLPVSFLSSIALGAVMLRFPRTKVRPFRSAAGGKDCER